MAEISETHDRAILNCAGKWECMRSVIARLATAATIFLAAAQGNCDDLKSRAENVDPSELQKALSVLDSTTEMGERIRVSQTVLGHAKCLGFLGANGEVIIRWRDPRQPHEASLAVVPENDEYRAIVITSEWSDLNLKFGDTYARIAADGTFALAVDAGLRRSLPLSPERWPRNASDSGLLFPDSLTVITNEVERTEQKEQRASDAMLGWCLLEWAGDLIAPTPDVERPSNFLWIVKASDGIQFVHSGPLCSDVYASISADRRVTYGVGAPDKRRTRKAPDWWPYVKEGVIVPVPEGYVGRPSAAENLLSDWNGEEFVGLSLVGPRPVK